jgi:hypothetical protein
VSGSHRDRQRYQKTILPEAVGLVTTTPLHQEYDFHQPPDNGEYGGISQNNTIPMDGNIITSTMPMGGGVSLFAAPVMKNTVLADNMPEHGRTPTPHSSPSLIHSTIARNQGGDNSGISVIHGEACDCTVEMTNTILVSHTVGITVSRSNTLTLVGTLWYSNTTDWDGAGTVVASAPNLYDDPQFAADGYHISAGSPAIDQGVPAGVTSDVDGNPRDLLPDLGADEIFACSPLTGVTITGPAEGYTGVFYSFTAGITPPGATAPIVYTWSPEPASGQGSSTASYSWTDEGDQTISVTASNCDGGGSASDDHVITLAGGIEWKIIPAFVGKSGHERIQPFQLLMAARFGCWACAIPGCTHGTARSAAPTTGKTICIRAPLVTGSGAPGPASAPTPYPGHGFPAYGRLRHSHASLPGRAALRPDHGRFPSARRRRPAPDLCLRRQCHDLQPGRRSR